MVKSLLDEIHGRNTETLLSVFIGLSDLQIRNSLSFVRNYSVSSYVTCVVLHTKGICHKLQN